MLKDFFNPDETDLVITYQMIASDDLQQAPDGPGWYLVTTRNKGRTVVNRRRINRTLVSEIAELTDAVVPDANLQEAVAVAEEATAHRLANAREQARIAAVRAERFADASEEFRLPEPEVTEPERTVTDEGAEMLRAYASQARTAGGNAARRAAEAVERTDLPPSVRNVVGRLSKRLNGDQD